MPSVVRPLLLVEVVPTLSHHGDPPGRRVPVIEVVEAALGPLEVVGVVDVGVVEEPFPVGRLPLSGGPRRRRTHRGSHGHDGGYPHGGQWR